MIFAALVWHLRFITIEYNRLEPNPSLGNVQSLNAFLRQRLAVLLPNTLMNQVDGKLSRSDVVPGAL